MPVIDVVAHAIYRIFTKTNKDTAFEFAVKVDEEQPTDIYDFQTKMRSVGTEMRILSEVLEVLVELGLRDADEDDPAHDGQDTGPYEDNYSEDEEENADPDELPNDEDDFLPGEE